MQEKNEKDTSQLHREVFLKEKKKNVSLASSEYKNSAEVKSSDNAKVLVDGFCNYLARSASRVLPGHLVIITRLLFQIFIFFLFVLRRLKWTKCMSPAHSFS